jgi:hypothetical protein
MDAAIRQQVRQRAQYKCEYCQIPEAATPFITFHAEHIIARQHQVDDSLDNLALSCDRCNAYKGPNLSSIDPTSKAIVELFHPRKNAWSDHFEVQDGIVLGKTANGRATVKLLNMNAARRVQLRMEFQ